MIEFEHELAIKETGVNVNNFSKSLKTKIIWFNKRKKDLYSDPKNVDDKKKIQLIAYSAVIADEIQDFIEEQLPDEAPGLTLEEKQALKDEYAARRAKKKLKEEND